MIALTFVDRVWRWSRDEGLQVVLIVLGTLLAVRVVRWVIGRVDARMSKRQPSDTLVLTEEAKRRNALLGVVTYVGVILVWAVGVFMMLERLGVNTGPLVASAGVLGLAVGFGAQSLVKDLVSGFFILAEGHYGVGDNIEINTNNDLIGTVERITLRTTVLRAVSGEVHIVPNGEIKAVTNRSKEWARAVVDVVLAYDADLNESLDGLHDAVDALKDDPDLSLFLLEDPEVWGVESLSERDMRVRVVAKTLPLKQWQVARALRMRIIEQLHTRGVRLPNVMPVGTPPPDDT